MSHHLMIRPTRIFNRATSAPDGGDMVILLSWNPIGCLGRAIVEDGVSGPSGA